MIVLSGALVLVALVLLVFGALDRNLPYVYASIGVSVLSLLLLVVGILQRRGELAPEDDGTTPVTDTSADRVPALVGAAPEQGQARQADGDTLTAELPAPVVTEQAPVSRRVVPEDAPQEPEDGKGDFDEPEEPAALPRDAEQPDEDELGDDLDAEGDEFEDEGDEFEDEGSGVTVLVVSGRPRYHLDGCRVLRGKEPEALDRDEARGHGFTPCGVCKPDVDGVPAQDEPAAVTPSVVADEPAEHGQPVAASTPTASDGESFTEVPFGEPLFADTPAAGSSAPPDRPLQPDVQPEAARRSARELAVTDQHHEPPAELRGEDPADETTRTTLDDDGNDDGDAAEPSPDVAANPDELATLDEPDGAESDETAQEQSGVAAVPADGLPADDLPAHDLPADDLPVDHEPPAEDGLDAAGQSSSTGQSPDAEQQAPAAQAEQQSEEDPSLEVPAVADQPPVLPGQTSSSRTATSDGVQDVPATTRTGGETASRKKAAAKTPAKKAPAGKAAAKKAPAKKAPAEKPAAKKAPARKAPAEKAPVTKAPAKQAVTKAPAPAPEPKRPLVRTVRADALRPGTSGTGVTTRRVAARAAAPATGGSVVVVPDRDRFHRPDCRFVRDVDAATTLPKASATRQGYAACGTCKP